MRIVSRLNEEETQIERLQSILEAASYGVISEHGSTIPGENLDDLVTQVDETMADFMETVDNLEEGIDNLQSEVMGLSVQCEAQQRLLEDLVNGVSYDEALDEATIVLIDALLGSGGATTTFDGDLSFDENVTYSKQDLKPFLRQAIDTWISLKVR